MVNQFSSDELLTRKFNKTMQEAGELYARKRDDAPEFDHDFLKTLKQNKRRRRYKRAVQAVAMFMVILTGGLSFGIWMNADGAYGGRRLVHKYVNIIEPFNIEYRQSKDGHTIESAIITDESQIKDAKEFAEILYVPHYIPEEYQFRSLTIEKDADYIVLDYLYVDENKEKLLITFKYCEAGLDSDVTLLGESYKSSATGETLYATKDTTNMYCVSMVGEKQECFITGIGDAETGIKIIENFKKE